MAQARDTTPIEREMRRSVLAGAQRTRPDYGILSHKCDKQAAKIERHTAH